MNVQTDRPEGQTQTATQIAAQGVTQSARESLSATMERLSNQAQAELMQASESKGARRTERYVSALEYQNRALLEAWKEQYPEDVAGLQYSDGISVEVPSAPERVPHTATIGGHPVLVSEDTARLIAFNRAVERLVCDLEDVLERVASRKACERLTAISWDLHGLMSTVIGERVIDDTYRHEQQGYILI